MRFLNPNFLWALLLIIVPIIIHLFYFRRYKKIYFSNTNFLNEIKDEQATRNKLKHLLVLLSRILAIIFLVLAFAQPFIPNNKQIKQVKKLVSIYLDNSFSMGAEGSGVLLFDEAKETAKKIFESYSERNSFQILSNDFEAKHQRIVSKSEALDLLEDIKITAAYQQKEDIVSKQLNVSNKFKDEKIFYQLSDFQQVNGLFDADTLNSFNLIKLQPTTVRNLSIQNVEFENPVFLKDQSNKLLVTIKNQSKEEKSGSFQLSINGVQKSLGNYTIAPNAETTDTLSFTINEKGWNKGEITLNDYPLIFDDDFYFTFFVEDKIKVYSIYEGNTNSFIKAVFSSNEQVDYKEDKVSNIDYKQIENQHLVVLSNIKSIPTGLINELQTFVEAGGQLFITPNENLDINSYNQLLQKLQAGKILNINKSERKVTDINTEHILFDDIFMEKPKQLDLPKVAVYLNLSNTINQEPIMSFSDRNPFLSVTNSGKGKVYVLSSPLGSAYSNFTSQAIFAPLVYKMAVLGVKSNAISFPLSTNTKVTLNKLPKDAEATLSIKNEDIELIPQKSIYNGLLQLQFPTKGLKSGFYEVKSNTGDYEAFIALNYDREESLLNYYSKEEIEQHFVSSSNVKVLDNNLAQISENVKLLENGKSYWKLCVILALLFLAIEILILRFLPN